MNFACGSVPQGPGGSQAFSGHIGISLGAPEAPLGVGRPQKKVEVESQPTSYKLYFLLRFILIHSDYPYSVFLSCSFFFHFQDTTQDLTHARSGLYH